MSQVRDLATEPTTTAIAKNCNPKKRYSDCKTISNMACNNYRETQQASSTHIGSEWRREQYSHPAPYPKWEYLPDVFKDGIFCDDIYFDVSCFEYPEIHAGSGKPKLPDSSRKAIQSLFGEAGKRMSVETKGVSLVEIFDYMPIFTVNAKCQNIDIQTVLDVLARFKDRGNRGLDVGGVRIYLKDVDFTINFPGAVAPAKHSDRLPILDGTFEAKKNIHYVGYHCITWTPVEGKHIRGLRYRVRDVDGKSKRVFLSGGGIDCKLYDKLIYHFETTFVQSESGNNLANLARSKSDNIQFSSRNPEIQKHGWGRLELRIRDKGSIPTDLEGLELLLARFYDATVSEYCHSESFNDTCRWFFDKKRMHQTLWLGLHKTHNEDAPVYVATMVRWANLLTSNYHVESCNRLEGDEAVSEFIEACAIPDVPLTVYAPLGDAGWCKYDIDTTGKSLPNIKYLAGDRPSRAKWCKYRIEDFGMDPDCFPFEITDKPIPRGKAKISEAPVRNVCIGAKPVVRSKTEYNRAVKKWWAAIKREQKRLLKLLGSTAKRKEKQIRKFSDTKKVPNRVLVSRVEIDKKYGKPVVLGDNGILFRVPRHLEKQLTKLSKSGSYRKYPHYVIRGRQTGKYKGNPVYGEAQIVVIDNMEKADSLEYGNQWSALFLEETDYVLYKDFNV